MHIEVVLSPNMKWPELLFLISLLHCICIHHVLRISASSTSERLADYEKKKNPRMIHGNTESQ